MNKKKVCIIGGGPAGLACAWSLSKKSDLFDIELWEMNSYLGSNASSVQLDDDLFMNFGTQYHPASAHHTRIFNNLLESPSEAVDLSFSVKLDENSLLSTNENSADFSQDFYNFQQTMNKILYFPHLFKLFSIDKFLTICGYSQEFRFNLIYPLLALYFGDIHTVSQLPCATVAQAFAGDFKLFEFDKETRALQTQRAVKVFADFQKSYSVLVDQCANSVKFFTNRKAKRVTRESGRVQVEDGDNKVEIFDEIVFACAANTCLDLLQSNANWMEKFCLSRVKYLERTTVTHSDTDYIQEIHSTDHGDNLFDKQFLFSTSQNNNAADVEMTMILNNIQRQLQRSEMIYQSHFFGQSKDYETNIDNTCIYMISDWRSALPNCYILPFLRFIQSASRHTWFCGGWTLADVHEVALISGLAAAYRISKHYPTEFDDKAEKQFKNYLTAVHGLSYSRWNWIQRFHLSIGRPLRSFRSASQFLLGIFFFSILSIPLFVRWRRQSNIIRSR